MDVEPEEVLAEINRRQRAKFIDGLRELADFLEQHAHAPVVKYASINGFAETKEELADIARRIGHAEKKVTGDWYMLEKKFAKYVTYGVNIERVKVCERKVVGTRDIPAHTEEIVEWECKESILAGGGE